MATKQKTVGIRVPDSPICHLLLATLGNPIINTSIPIDDAPPPTEAYEIDALIGNRLDAIIDGDILELIDALSIADLNERVEQSI